MNLKVLKIKITNETDYLKFKNKLIKQLIKIEKLKIDSTLIEIENNDIQEIIKFLELIKLYLSGFNDKNEMKTIHVEIKNLENMDNELVDVLKNYQIPIFYHKNNDDDIEKLLLYVLQLIGKNVGICLMMENKKENEWILNGFTNKKLLKKLLKYVFYIITYRKDSLVERSKKLNFFEIKNKIEFYNIDLKKEGEF